jgi:hypothetical protein
MEPSTETQPPKDEIRQAAASAMADVAALNATGDERNILLKALLKARLSLALSGTSANTPVRPDQPSTLGGDQPQLAVGDVIGKLAAGLRLDRDTLDLVYALQDGEPHLVISAKKIAANKALGTRQIGQLVAAARQIAGIEEWTSAATIRQVVTDYGRLDGSNFAATLQQMDNIAVIRGKGQQREVKITKPGIENTADLINSLVGGAP